MEFDSNYLQVRIITSPGRSTQSQINNLYQIKTYTHSGRKNIKPEYKKPVAMPLGEAAKGSGPCAGGSGGGVAVISDCNNGSFALSCGTGNHADAYSYGW